MTFALLGSRADAELALTGLIALVTSGAAQPGAVKQLLPAQRSCLQPPGPCPARPSAPGCSAAVQGFQVPGNEQQPPFIMHLLYAGLVLGTAVS